jgi:hypothetical protein
MESFRRKPESMNTASTGLTEPAFMDPGFRRDDSEGSRGAGRLPYGARTVSTALLSVFG